MAVFPDLQLGLLKEHIPGMVSLQHFVFIKCFCSSEWSGSAKLGLVPSENH